MRSFTTDYACPSCRSGLSISKKNIYSCRKCNMNYPIFWNNVPVFLENSENYLLQYNLFLNQFLTLENDQNQHLLKRIEDSSPRSSFLTELLKARVVNLKLIKSLSEDIARRSHKNSKQKIKDLRGSQKFGYYPKINFNYLRRDWSKLSHVEEEIELIKNEIFKAVSFSNIELKNIIVAGAATARIAYELALENGTSVYAFDKSLVFASLFNSLFNSKINFYDISLKNRITKNDCIRKFELAKVKPLKNLKYSISDAAKLPFTHSNTSIIISLFFTDVIPINSWIKEIYRCLHKGGVFIHLGPLDYHFNELEYQYSIEELKEQFVENKFEIVYENFVKMPHLNHGDQHLSLKVYNTYVFTARKLH